MEFSQYKEPASSKYIYVDDQNIVHFLMPLIRSGGTAERPIGTDNTCQAVKAIKDFFENEDESASGLAVLIQYKAHLTDDIRLNLCPQITKKKQERLAQIEAYLQALTAIRSRDGNISQTSSWPPKYPTWVKPFFSGRTNLLSMRLRPILLDPYLRLPNPVFSVYRPNTNWLLSVMESIYREKTSRLFSAMNNIFSNIQVIRIQSPQRQLAQAVTETLRDKVVTFSDIQKTLTTKTKELFNEEVVYTYGMQPQISFQNRWSGRALERQETNKQAIEALIGIRSTSTTEDIEPDMIEEYTEALIQFCSASHWETLFTPPFSIDMNREAKKKLIIITQFFLAEVNIYCYENSLSNVDFGQVLDSSAFFSRLFNLTFPSGEAIAQIVKAHLEAGTPVEKALFDYINIHHRSFGLSAPLNEAAFQQIQTNFTTDYNSVKGIEEFDEFLILTNKPGVAKSHCGAISIPFANVISSAFSSLDNVHFQKARQQQLPHVIPHQSKLLNALESEEIYRDLINLVITGNITQAANLLLASVENNQLVFEKLDAQTKLVLFGSPHWARLNAHTQNYINDDATLEKYHSSFSFYTLTTSQVAYLYYKAVADKLYDPMKFSEFTAEHLKVLLSNNLEGDIFVKNTPNGVLINLARSKIDHLRALLQNNENQLHCTEAMVELFYQEAIRIHGATSPEITQVNQQTTLSQRLKATLPLLRINFEDIIANSDSTNLVIKTASSVDIMRLLNILQQKSRFDAAVKTLEEHASELQNRGHGDSYQAANALITALKQHGDDYFINHTIDFTTFRDLCRVSIEAKQEVLETHHGWKAILAGFLKVINTLIYPLTLFNNNTFFKMTPTDSIRKVEAFNEELETAFNQEHTFGA